MVEFASLDDLKLVDRKLFFDTYIFNDRRNSKIHIEEQQDRLDRGISLSAEFISEVLLCLFHYTYSLFSSSGSLSNMNLSQIDIKSLAMNYTIELIYSIFQVNLKNLDVWGGVHPLEVISNNLHVAYRLIGNYKKASESQHIMKRSPSMAALGGVEHKSPFSIFKRKDKSPK